MKELLSHSPHEFQHEGLPLAFPPSPLTTTPPMETAVEFLGKENKNKKRGREREDDTGGKKGSGC